MSTEEQLGHTLRRQAEGVDDQPLTLDDVRGRARRIRRRQASGVAAGVALMAAVALPIALLGGAGTDKSEPSPAPSPTRAVDPNDRGVPTLQDGVIIYQDGPRIPLELDPSEIILFTPLGTDRWVLTTSTDDGTAVVVVGPEGRTLSQYEQGGNATLAVSDDRDAVAWMGPDRSPMLLVAGADEPKELARPTFREADVATISGDCATECEVIGLAYDDNSYFGSSWAVSTTGTVRSLPDAVPWVLDATDDGSLLAGLDRIAPDDIHTCGGVYDVPAGDFAWADCEANAFSFSPDGALVATLFSEGAGPRSVSIRDSMSGTRVGGLGDARLIQSWAWEDEEHLLVVVAADDGAVSVRRLGSDGSTETVLDGFHADDPTLDFPVRLPNS